jgi:NagD protein
MIDVQGTIIDDIDRKPIDGAVEAIKKLKNSDAEFVLVTNNTKFSSSDFMAYLRVSGFEFDDEQYLDPFSALKDIVQAKSIWAIGNRGFVDALKDEAYAFDSHSPDYLVLSLKEDLSYNDLADCVEYILGGAKLVGMHETAIYAKNGRKYPGLGALLRCLEYSTNTTAISVGKPSVDFYMEAKKLLNAADFSEITIVSDDAIGDLKGAKKLGMKTVLVLSGKYKKAEEIIPFLDECDRPDAVYDSIADIDFLNFSKGQK